MPVLFAAGGAHVDRRARLLSAHRPATSNPAAVSEEAGGGAFNALRAARRFGVGAVLVSSRGADGAGARVEAAIRDAGVRDLSSIHLDRATPSYTSLLEPGGELVTAIADMALYDTGPAKALRRAPAVKAAAEADAFLLDANLPAAAAEAVAALAGTRPLHALAVSAAKVVRLASLFTRIDTLFCNVFEASVLTGLPADAAAPAHARALLASGVRRVSVTQGAAPAAFGVPGRVFTLAPPSVTLRDATGAGDALAGTLVAGLMNGLGFEQAARLGVAAAALTASREGAVPVIGRAEIEALASGLPPAADV